MTHKLINLNNSYVYININSKNTWRSSVNSMLSDISDQTEYYMLNECIAENIGDNPFKNSQGYEYCHVASNKKDYIKIRSVAVKSFNIIEYQHQRNNVENKLNIQNTKYKIIDHLALNKNLKNYFNEKIFSLIEYSYQGKDFSVFSECKYLNFDGAKNIENKIDSNYVQPIMGYIPFEKDRKIYKAYYVKYVSTGLDGKLEIMFSDYTNIFNKRKLKSSNFVKLIIKMIINFFSFKKNSFDNYISITNSKITFFQKDTD